MIAACGLDKTYVLGDVRTVALRDITVSFPLRDYAAICGASGSGKTTLLNIVGLLDAPTAGAVLYEGNDVSGVSDLERSRIRNHELGFVFQGFNLIPELSTWQNVALPGRYAGLTRRLRQERAHELLDQVGLADHADHYPAQLSGGQEQRVAIARALYMSPRFLLADEPTGNLDSACGLSTILLLEALHDEGAALLVVTHDGGLASRASRVITLKDGHIEAIEDRSASPV